MQKVTGRKKSKKYTFPIKITDNFYKQLISISKSAIAFANRLGGYSVYDFDKPTTKALKIKFERAGRLAEDYALTADKVKKLEMATLGFAQTVVEAAKVTKETTTTK